MTIMQLWYYKIHDLIGIISNFYLKDIIPDKFLCYRVKSPQKIKHRIKVLLCSELSNIDMNKETSIVEETESIAEIKAKFNTIIGQHESKIIIQVNKKILLLLNRMGYISSVNIMLGRILNSILEQYLALNDCTFLHGAALKFGATSVILTGPSSVGKTTTLMYLARNYDAEILSDDQPIVDAQGFVLAYPDKHTLLLRHSPFLRTKQKIAISLIHLASRLQTYISLEYRDYSSDLKYASRDSAKLRLIVFLERSSHTKIKHLNCDEAVELLIQFKLHLRYPPIPKYFKIIHIRDYVRLVKEILSKAIRHAYCYKIESPDITKTIGLVNALVKKYVL